MDTDGVHSTNLKLFVRPAVDMKGFALLATAAACCANLALSVGSDNDPDVFKTWVAFPDGIAISSSSADGLFECADATRTALDADTKSVDYDFYFPSNGITTKFHLKADDTPGSATFTVGTDPTPSKAKFYYSDYKTCAVQRINYNGDACMLWVRKQLKDSLPQSCIQHFEEACGVQVPADGQFPCAA